MLPAVDQPTRVVLPDGRSAVITVTISDPPERPTIAVPLPLVTPPAIPRPVQRPAAPARSALDDPLLGGRLTAFVLLFGTYHDMHRRCLNSLLSSTPRERVAVRVAGNELCGPTRAFVEDLVERGDVERFYDAGPANLKKYPVMRTMFRDPACPIKTKWLLWLDDDTFCDRNSRWLERLAEEIISGARKDPHMRMIGPKKVYTLAPSQAQWVRTASWYQGQHFQDISGRSVPNGRKIHFSVGAFWALKTECIETCDIPDGRLGHNGGDWAIAVQLAQRGYTVKSFSVDKSIVNWSAVPRRGLAERHPGL